MQDNREDKRGYCQIGCCHCLTCCVSELCWASAHESWLTEWSRLHGCPIDDSLVSSAHPLGYGDKYFNMTIMLPATELLLSRNGRHSMTSELCAKSTDIRPTDNLWADSKRNLSRSTPRNVLEFEIIIHDILSETGPVNAW